MIVLQMKCAADKIKLIKINNYQLNVSSMCDVQIPSNYMHLNERRTKYDTRVEGHPRRLGKPARENRRIMS